VSNLLLIMLVTLYTAQLVLQLPFEERGLRRFGPCYSRYCRLVTRFIPRLRPVRQQDWPEIRGASGF
jgi:protein-S-isoprenylcysteine O-methyltransferase Ste14